MTDRPDEDLRSQWAQVTDAVVDEMVERLDLEPFFTPGEALRFRGALDFIVKMECLPQSLETWLERTSPDAAR